MNFEYMIFSVQLFSYGYYSVHYIAIIVKRDLPIKTPIDSPANAANSCIEHTEMNISNELDRLTIGKDIARKRNGRNNFTGSSDKDFVKKYADKRYEPAALSFKIMFLSGRNCIMPV